MQEDYREFYRHIGLHFHTFKVRVTLHVQRTGKILVCMLIGETHFGSQKCFKTSFPPRLGGVSGMYNVHVYLHLEPMCLSRTCTYKLDEC